jgi:hypothetical protein
MNHDIDHTLNELEMEGEWEAPFADDFEAEAGELEWEAGEFETLEFEDDYEDNTAQAADSPLSDEEEMEFAMELLDITSDADLDQFLGRVVRRAARGARNVARRGRRFLRSPAGRRLTGIARGVARRALPAAGRALGTAIGGPVGGAIGGRAASAAGRALGLELEGLSPEDQEFEVARRVVRFTAGATNAAVADEARGTPAVQALRRGVVAAARQHAPGLLQGGRQSGGRASSGRWIRRGNRIILSGV